MQRLIKHFDEWVYVNSDLVEEMLEKQSKAIVVISGASSSGKSFTAHSLAKQLSNEGHNVLNISLDQYNNGLSGIIPNKVNEHDFNNSLNNPDKIKAEIKKIIIDIPFEEKYSDSALKLIKNSIRDYFENGSDLDKFLSACQREWKVVNFDESSVYNLNEAAEDVKLLLANKKIKEKRYSKIVSERLETNTFIDGKDYDVIILEGIYALDKSFVDNLKDVMVAKNFISSNPKSLFLRRMIRDAKETSASNAFTMNIYFKYIVESYKNTILPTKASADIVFQNDMTFFESREGLLYKTKDDHFVSKKEVENLKKKAEIIHVSYRKDFYFKVEGEKNPDMNILRLREYSRNQGKTYQPGSIVHKGTPKVRKDDKIIRPVNVFLNEDEFPLVWKDEESCLNDFKKAGFEVYKIERKIKTKVKYMNAEFTIFELEDKQYLEHPSDISEKKMEEIINSIK